MNFVQKQKEIPFQNKGENMSEESLEIGVAMLLARWMGGENLREATEEVVKLARLYYETGTIEEVE